MLSTRGFSRKRGLNRFCRSLRRDQRLIASRRYRRSVCRLRVQEQPPTGLNQHDHTVAGLPFSVPSSFNEHLPVQEY